MITLDDITLNIVDGVHGDCDSDDDSGYYFISVKDMRDFQIDYTNARQITKEDFHKADLRTRLEENDVLFANTGDTIGKMLRVTNSTLKIGKTTFQKSVAILKPDTSKINPLYFYYLIKFNVQGLRRTAVGSSQKNLLLGDMRTYEVKINHDLNLQGQIVHVLHAIDEKIENNHKINDNLQQQLKLLYDYWFTQFDFPDDNGNPYRASGGKMVWNKELNQKIPEGWECKSLGELLQKNTTPFDYKTIQPTIDLSVMPSASIALNKLNSSDNFSTNLFVMKEGDILFGSIRPYLKKAGIAPCDGVVAGTIHSYHPIKDSDYNFALLTISRDVFFDYAVRVSSGTKMPVISSDNLLAYKVPYSEDVAKLFNDVNAMQIICRNVQEIQQLISLRDWLLPMLMNGYATIVN